MFNEGSAHWLLGPCWQAPVVGQQGSPVVILPSLSLTLAGRVVLSAQRQLSGALPWGHRCHDSLALQALRHSPWAVVHSTSGQKLGVKTVQCEGALASTVCPDGELLMVGGQVGSPAPRRPGPAVLLPSRC